MKAKQLKDKFYIASEKQNLIYCITQVQDALSVTVELVDSLPEDGEEVYAGDITILALFDNLGQMAKQLSDEAVNTPF